jgi:hypothetical protein
MLIYSSSYISDVNAERKRLAATADCWDLTNPPGVLCCWQEKDTDTGLTHDVCVVCYDGPPAHCEQVHDKIVYHGKTNQDNTFHPPKGGGILEQDKQTPSNNSKIHPPTGLVS